MKLRILDWPVWPPGGWWDRSQPQDCPGGEGRAGRGGEGKRTSSPSLISRFHGPPARTTRITRCGQKKEVTKAKDQKEGFYKDRKDSCLVPTDADPVDLGSQLCLPLTPPPAQIIKK